MDRPDPASQRIAEVIERDLVSGWPRRRGRRYGVDRLYASLPASSRSPVVN